MKKQRKKWKKNWIEFGFPVRDLIFLLNQPEKYQNCFYLIFCRQRSPQVLFDYFIFYLTYVFLDILYQFLNLDPYPNRIGPISTFKNNNKNNTPKSNGINWEVILMILWFKQELWYMGSILSPDSSPYSPGYCCGGQTIITRRHPSLLSSTIRRSQT